MIFCGVLLPTLTFNTLRSDIFQSNMQKIRRIISIKQIIVKRLRLLFRCFVVHRHTNSVSLWYLSIFIHLSSVNTRTIPKSMFVIQAIRIGSMTHSHARNMKTIPINFSAIVPFFHFLGSAPFHSGPIQLVRRHKSDNGPFGRRQ